MQLLSEKSKASERLTCIFSSPFFKSYQILLEFNSLEVYWAPTMLMKGGRFSNHFSGEMSVESRTMQTTLEPCLSSDLWLQRYPSTAMCLTICFFFLLIHCCCFKDLCIIKGGFPKSPQLKIQPECMLSSWSQCMWRYYYWCWCSEYLLSVHCTWDTVLRISKSV